MTSSSDDPEEPRLEWAVIAKPAQLAPGAFAGLLDCVLSQARIVQNRARIPVGGVDRRSEYGLEGLDLTALSPCDELLLGTDLHNLTLNTGTQSRIVSAIIA